MNGANIRVWISPSDIHLKVSNAPQEIIRIDIPVKNLVRKGNSPASKHFWEMGKQVGFIPLLLVSDIYIRRYYS